MGENQYGSSLFRKTFGKRKNRLRIGQRIGSDDQHRSFSSPPFHGVLECAGRNSFRGEILDYLTARIKDAECAPLRKLNGIGLINHYLLPIRITGAGTGAQSEQKIHFPVLPGGKRSKIERESSGFVRREGKLLFPFRGDSAVFLQSQSQFNGVLTGNPVEHVTCQEKAFAGAEAEMFLAEEGCLGRDFFSMIVLKMAENRGRIDGSCPSNHIAPGRKEREFHVIGNRADGVNGISIQSRSKMGVHVHALTEKNYFVVKMEQFFPILIGVVIRREDFSFLPIVRIFIFRNAAESAGIFHVLRSLFRMEEKVGGSAHVTFAMTVENLDLRTFRVRNAAADCDRPGRIECGNAGEKGPHFFPLLPAVRNSTRCRYPRRHSPANCRSPGRRDTSPDRVVPTSKDSDRQNALHGGRYARGFRS